MNSEILKKIENYCSYQERCKKEVIEKLFRLNVEQPEVDNIINYLTKNSYINEERFALAFAHGKFVIKRWGKIKIIIELKNRKIDSNLISKAINQITDSEYQNMFNDISLKKFNSLDGSLDSRKRKFINYFSYRGWEYDLVIRKLNEFF